MNTTDTTPTDVTDAIPASAAPSDDRANTKERARSLVAQTAAKGTENKADEVKEMMDVLAPQFAEMLGRHSRTDRFKRIVLNLVTQNPRLMECNTKSLANSILQAAALDMEPNTVLGLCFIIPRRDNQAGTLDATFQVGYQGWLALARRSGQILDVHADVVYAEDFYEAWHGAEPHLKHIPARKAERGEMLLVYAYARLKGGGFVFVELLPHQLTERKARSKSGATGPWNHPTDKIEMAKKSALITLHKYLPKNQDYQIATVVDEDAGMLLAPSEDATNTLGPGAGTALLNA